MIQKCAFESFECWAEEEEPRMWSIEIGPFRGNKRGEFKSEFKWEQRKWIYFNWHHDDDDDDEYGDQVKNLDFLK